MNSRAHDSLAQDSMTNNFYFHISDFLRIFVYVCVKYEGFSSKMYMFRVNSLCFNIRDFSRIFFMYVVVSSNMYMFRVNCVIWLLDLFYA